MEWLFLALAIVFENSGTVFMKLSNGLTRLVPSILIWVCYIPSFLMLSLALRKIDVSIAYAIWSGVGTATIAIIGILFFQEPLNWVKVVSLGLIIMGVIGLNLSGG
jgi:small multidrug resistance pump